MQRMKMQVNLTTLFLLRLLMQDATKSDSDWSKDYANYWDANIANIINNLPGYPQPVSDS